MIENSPIANQPLTTNTLNTTSITNAVSGTRDIRIVTPLEALFLTWLDRLCIFFKLLCTCCCWRPARPVSEEEQRGLLSLRGERNEVLDVPVSPPPQPGQRSEETGLLTGLEERPEDEANTESFPVERPVTSPLTPAPTYALLPTRRSRTGFQYYSPHYFRPEGEHAGTPALGDAISTAGREPEIHETRLPRSPRSSHFSPSLLPSDSPAHSSTLEDRIDEVASDTERSEASEVHLDENPTVEQKNFNALTVQGLAGQGEDYQPTVLLNGFLAYTKRYIERMERSEVTFNRQTVTQASSLITATSPLLVPCIAASRVGSDVSAACTTQNISINNTRNLLILLHPRAQHNSTVYPTRNKSGDFVGNFISLIDVVFWNDAIYDCLQNQQAARELINILEGREVNEERYPQQ